MELELKRAKPRRSSGFSTQKKPVTTLLQLPECYGRQSFQECPLVRASALGLKHRIDFVTCWISANFEDHSSHILLWPVACQFVAASRTELLLSRHCKVLKSL